MLTVKSQLLYYFSKNVGHTLNAPSGIPQFFRLFKWRQKKLLWQREREESERERNVTIGGRSWSVWWGRRWRGRPGGRGSWAAARWPRRQPAGCSSSLRAVAASGRAGGWDWWPQPGQTKHGRVFFTTVLQSTRISNFIIQIFRYRWSIHHPFFYALPEASWETFPYPSSERVCFAYYKAPTILDFINKLYLTTAFLARTTWVTSRNMWT